MVVDAVAALAVVEDRADGDGVADADCVADAVLGCEAVLGVRGWDEKAGG